MQGMQQQAQSLQQQAQNMSGNRQSGMQNQAGAQGMAAGMPGMSKKSSSVYLFEFAVDAHAPFEMFVRFLDFSLQTLFAA